MSLREINPEPLLARAWVAEGRFHGNPLKVADVGARHGFEEHWRAVYQDQVRLFGFEPDPAECLRLDQLERPRGGRVFPCALHAEAGTRTFFLTNYPASCGFYEPDQAFWSRFTAQANLAVKSRVEMPVQDYVSVARRENLPPMDFIKLDTEGCELDILRGGMEVLAGSLLGVSIEVELAQVHLGQPLFHDVDRYLRSAGFELMDLCPYKFSRLAQPSSFTPHASGQGQVLWAQALYLRDPVRELRDPSKRAFWDGERLLKVISLMDLFQLQDCAVEAILEGRDRGLWDADTCQPWLDLAAASMNQGPVPFDTFRARTLLRDLPWFTASLAEDQRTLPATMDAVARCTGIGDVAGLAEAVEAHLRGLSGEDSPDSGTCAMQRLYFEEYRRQLPVLAGMSRAEVRYHAEMGRFEDAESGPTWNYERLRLHISTHLEGRYPGDVVCFGAGHDFRRLLADGVFGKHRVVAVIDNLRPEGERVESVPVVPLEALDSLDPAAVVVTSSRWSVLFRRQAAERTFASARPRPVI